MPPSRTLLQRKSRARRLENQISKESNGAHITSRHWLHSTCPQLAAFVLSADTVALLLLWSVIGYAALMVETRWWLRLLLGIIALGVTLHLLSLNTLAQRSAHNVGSRDLTAQGDPGGRERGG